MSDTLACAVPDRVHRAACLGLIWALAACWSGTSGGLSPSKAAVANSADSAAEALAASAVELTVGGRADSLDLSAVGRLVGDAHVVMLGEPWHGDGGAIARRAEIVRYLHERKGFDVLVFEADFYALHEAWRDVPRTGDVRAVMDQVYPFWTDTRAARPLWDYVAARLHAGDTLHVAGVDTKLVGPRSHADLPRLVADRYAALAGADPAIGRDAAATLDAALVPRPATRALLTDTRFRTLLGVVRQLERAAHDRLSDAGGIRAGAPGALTDADVFWAQAVNSLWRNLTAEARDPGMGANFFWLATRQYPGHKLILWAHNNHLVADKWMWLDSPDSLAGLSRTDVARARITYLGDEVRRAFGRRAVTIATTSNAGRYSPDIQPALGERDLMRAGNFDSTLALAPAAPGTLEAALARAGHRVALVDLRRFAGTPPIATRVLNYTALPPVRLALWRGYDGLLFLGRTVGLNDRPVAEEASAR